MDHNTFVQADGRLAERWCHVHLMGLTRERAEQLLHLHRHHRPDDCLVHLAAAVMLTETDDEL